MAKQRPYWQRVLLPFIGVLLCLAGIAGTILPVIPGIPFLIIGFPLVFCFHHEWEEWAMSHSRRLAAWAKQVIRRLRGRGSHR
jgi:uncharacterized membrane protein YbaN (DUF454 family)